VTHQTIVILDFGSQYTQLIARSLREMVCSRRFSRVTRRQGGVSAVAGRHHPVGRSAQRARTWRARAATPWRDATVPVLGICYGMQLMAHELGGHVEAARAANTGMR